MEEQDIIKDAGNEELNDLTSHLHQLNTRASKGFLEPREGTDLNRRATTDPHGQVTFAQSRKHSEPYSDASM